MLPPDRVPGDVDVHGGVDVRPARLRRFAGRGGSPAAGGRAPVVPGSRQWPARPAGAMSSQYPAHSDYINSMRGRGGVIWPAGAPAGAARAPPPGGASSGNSRHSRRRRTRRQDEPHDNPGPHCRLGEELERLDPDGVLDRLGRDEIDGGGEIDRVGVEVWLLPPRAFPKTLTVAVVRLAAVREGSRSQSASA